MIPKKILMKKRLTNILSFFRALVPSFMKCRKGFLFLFAIEEIGSCIREKERNANDIKMVEIRNRIPKFNG